MSTLTIKAPKSLSTKKHPSINLVEKESCWTFEYNNSCVGHVYLMQAEGTNRFKIGYSKNPEQRAMSLKFPQMPFKIKLLYQFRCLNMNWWERSLHDYYSEYRVNGEWFDIPNSQYEMDRLKAIFSLNYEGLSDTPFEYALDKIKEILEEWIFLNISKLTIGKVPIHIEKAVRHTAYLLSRCFDQNHFSTANVYGENCELSDVYNYQLFLNDSISKLHQFFWEMYFGNCEEYMSSSSLPVEYSGFTENAIIMWLGYLRGVDNMYS